MREIVPGIFHWSAFHEPIGQDVSSYYVAPAEIAIDPKVPEEGLEALPGRPKHVVLTIGLHHRDAAEFATAFDAPIRASREAADRLDGRLEVAPFGAGDEIVPGVSALRIGSLAPDEGALHIAFDEGALAIADGIVHDGDGLAFVPNSLMGDDPPAVKAGLKQAYARLLDREFDHLLFAHGEPIVGGGKAALREFIDN
jgi:hypothetical protein